MKTLILKILNVHADNEHCCSQTTNIAAIFPNFANIHDKKAKWISSETNLNLKV